MFRIWIASGWLLHQAENPTVWISVCLMGSMRLPAWKRHHFDMRCAPLDTGSADTGKCHKGNKPPSLAVHSAPAPARTPFPGAAAGLRAPQPAWLQQHFRRTQREVWVEGPQLPPRTQPPWWIDLNDEGTQTVWYALFLSINCPHVLWSLYRRYCSLSSSKLYFTLLPFLLFIL